MGVLLASIKTGRQLFETHLALLDYLNRKPETDEVDLVLFNEAPVRIAYSIIRNGRLLLCRGGKELTDFINEILVNQQINQSTNQPVNKSTSQPVNILTFGLLGSVGFPEQLRCLS